MTSRRNALGLGLGSLAAAVLPLAARAQGAWPERAVRIVVPYPAGGVNDVVARMLAEHLRPLLGQPVVVDNRAGAGGTIGMDAVARAQDGHTLAFAAISPLTLNPHVMKVPYDPLKDFVPVAPVMYSPVYVLATPRLPGASFEDAIAAAKAGPGRVSIASSGYGTLGHIMIEQIRRKSGADLTHVPYKGGTQLVTDAGGGQFDLFVANPFAAINNLIAEGKLRVLAVTGPRRLAAMPQVPTLAELGFPEANLTSLFGFYAPASLPAEAVRRLNGAINQVLADKEVQEQLRKLDNVVSPGTPQQFAALIEREHAANARIVKEANIKAE
ncbi:Bug family tripartite tricarboxylate transporter substrate binding protein [Ramlibacter tataouinensis]|uniref:Candidate extracytoplasmic binding receptor n=1 Tax=Ramlibacter tataouinensis (strain ATCC BAA-407 / DSM 14655 / LMG 21543 / TTB310) TaxID=365046 RepID=F5Y4Y2_RAMTT|nr:tripartite tricarboxylate transporter substrate binding protein [Ramlibacter tataouinensis]AEG92638.1 Candidate extracytoplasmic binding receptor [Ramlibacter tataouinensis TTB310]